MEVLTLLTVARIAGLSLAAEGDQLIIEGPRSAECLARELINRKSEVLPLVQLRGPRRTDWGTWAWSDPDAPALELFGPPQIEPTSPVRWRCLSPFAKRHSRWWLSRWGAVLCLECQPPSFPSLIIATGDAVNAPLVEAERRTTLAGPWRARMSTVTTAIAQAATAVP
jgi:hypothetical protein